MVVVDVEIRQDRNRPVTPRAVGLASDGERAEIGEAAQREIGDRGGEDLVAIQVEELDRAGDAQAEAGTGRGPARQQLTEGRRDRVEAIAALEVAARRCATNSTRWAGSSITWRRPQVRGCSATRVAPSSTRTRRSLETSDDALALGHRSRHRVPVGVELHEGLAVEVDQLDPIGRGQRCGERQEARALLGEYVTDGALGQDRGGAARVRSCR